MIKKILTLSSIFFSVAIFSQKDLMNGYIIIESNDTISGKLKIKDYSLARKINLYTDKSQIHYNKRVVKEINITGNKYIKSRYSILSSGFFMKKVQGPVNLYLFKNNIYLGAYDTDINIGLPKSSIRFYCSDYPNLLDSLKNIDKSNIIDLIINYNNWKASNPHSESYFEKNIHEKKLINFKISIFLPGAGFEFGVNEKITLNSMFKVGIGYGSKVGLIINPFIDSQIRYYHNIYKRKKNNLRTYKYSANFLSLINVMFIDNKATLFGFEYGWQRTIGKNWYSNIGIGIGKWWNYDSYAILYDLDFGYNF